MHSLYIKGSYIFKLSAALISTYKGLYKDIVALDQNLLVEHTWKEKMHEEFPRVRSSP